MTLLIVSFEGTKVPAKLVLYRYNDFIRQWVSLDGLCRFFETLEIVDKQRVGQPQIFCSELLHDGTKRQFMFRLCRLAWAREGFADKIATPSRIAPIVIADGCP